MRKLFRIPLLSLIMSIVIGIIRMGGNSLINRAVGYGWSSSITPGHTVLLFSVFLMVLSMGLIALCIAKFLTGMSRMLIRRSTWLTCGYILLVQLSFMAVYLLGIENSASLTLLSIPINIYYTATTLISALLEQVHPLISFLPPIAVPTLFLLGIHRTGVGD